MFYDVLDSDKNVVLTTDDFAEAVIKAVMIDNGEVWHVAHQVMINNIIGVELLKTAIENGIKVTVIRTSKREYHAVIINSNYTLSKLTNNEDVYEYIA